MGSQPCLGTGEVVPRPGWRGWETGDARMRANSNLVAADLFCGAGGLSVGFRESGFSMAFANDIDRDCAITYKHNHDGTVFFECPIENLSVPEIRRSTGIGKGDIDVLIGGPPCQGFSINAPRRSQEDTRNFLFEHYGRLVLEGLRPKVILMENVPGMLSLEGGRFVNAIYNLFGLSGYRMMHMVLCAAHYGVPQERWRLFFIGTILRNCEIAFPKPTHYADVRANFTGGRELTWLKGMPKRKDQASLFPEGSLQPAVIVRQAMDDLSPLGVMEGEESSPYPGGPNWPYQEALRRGSDCVYNHVSGALSTQNVERLKYVPPGGSWRDIPHDLLPRGMKLARRSDHTRRYGRLDPDGLSGTILTKCDPHWGTFFHYEQDRAITVREAARLQSFPDKFHFLGNRVSQYRQVGNAVPPKLAEVLAKHIKETFFQ